LERGSGTGMDYRYFKKNELGCEQTGRILESY
jgi:hypothetical protein